MSNMLRMSIGQWFCLIVGMGLMSFQLYKYFTNTLEISISEGVVTLLAAALMFAPKALSQAFKNVLNKKINNKS